MKYFVIIILTLFFSPQGYSQPDPSTTAFTGVDVKKKIADKTCDTCKVDFALHAIPEFSYVITGAEHTPPRFRHLLRSSEASHKGIEPNRTVHFISCKKFGISFLPTFISKSGKRTQLYRNFGTEDYNNLEFSAELNGRVLKEWAPLSGLGEDKEYTILGTKDVSGQTISIPWNRTFYAGNFDLKVQDTLNIIVRKIGTKKIIQTICVIRAEDKPTNFVYYQVPLTSQQFSENLQAILNLGSGQPQVHYGDSAKVFWKDYASVGILRFLGLRRNEVIQYSFNNKPDGWRSASSNSSEDVFIVLRDDIKPGTYQHIYLRYKTQPETVHKITLLVKEKPLEIPWRKIAGISAFLLLSGGIGASFWYNRYKQRLGRLKQKNEDVETRLSLLSGQLNPHFLFNSLHAIQGTINSCNPDRANTYISNVAGFMRSVMDSGKQEFVSLKEELKLEEDYLKLEQERKNFSCNITVAPGIEPSLIDFPPLLLQPVLENSIRHAFNTDIPDPVISVNISAADTTLYLELSDNGSTVWSPAAMKEGHGLSLTKKRIAVYNEKLESMFIDIQINYRPERGTVTTFILQNWLA